MPGEGVEVQPLKSSIAEETFQTLLVSRALEELGYDVNDIKEIEYAAGHVAIANGDGTFMADHWDPLHTNFYNRAGGDEKIYREGVYSSGALQGYLIDKATAEEYDITNIEQLKELEEKHLYVASLEPVPAGRGEEAGEDVLMNNFLNTEPLTTTGVGGGFSGPVQLPGNMFLFYQLTY